MLTLGSLFLFDPVNLAADAAVLSASVSSGWKVGKEIASTLAPDSVVEAAFALWGAVGGLWAAGYYYVLLYDSSAAGLYLAISGIWALIAWLVSIGA